MYDPPPGSGARFRSWRATGGSLAWLAIIPGVALMLFALAILIWPQLLAYLVAIMLLFAGAGLTVWGWSLRRASRRHQTGQNDIVYRIQ